MQKLLKRTAQAERQVARRMKKRNKEEERAELRRERPRIVDALRSIAKDNKTARRTWIENWELGPLAPKRDLGCNNYGVIWENYRRTPPRPSPQVLEQRCGWAGGPHQLCLAPGDRVLIMDGPDKGKIDCIKDIQHEHGTVKLETRHKGLFGTPMGGGGAAMDFPLSVGSIRLVYPLPHPQTGQIRDVVIQRLKAVLPNMKSEHMSYDRWEFGRKWDRMIPGISVVIPWPDGSAPHYESHKSDTLRDKVEERTFLFNLTSPPMPPSVLDELRNRYSKFRTRHEAWYVQKKEAEEAAKKAKASRDVLSMRTPMDEFAEKRKQLRLARPEPLLTDEMLERIGRIMLMEQRRASEWKEGEPPRVTGGPDVGKPGVGRPVTEPPVSDKEHGHSHEILDGPGSYTGRELPITQGRDWSSRAFTVGIGGPVGSGKTALMLALCLSLREKYSLAAVTNDIFTREDAEFLTRNRALPPSRIRAIETGGCPHAAVREDISANLAALEDLHASFSPDLLLIESGGDNLAANYSRELADFIIYVIDVSGGDKIPRKGGPGITQSDLLVVNKTDLAGIIGADLGVMERDARKMREGGPTVFAQVKGGVGWC
ncbi:hypothetical protein CDD80_7513 [Ophiocordyceps camponoti-rufipedis]|uniref:CobW/HypB/UreG nucleotide-binding domain-containing protein n=1 Tax=Ophiocordyceps camponoti-rufipedis TaxID=2004952 RepID=A0A2C5ZE58_9HYPO|nr:hypothetical protein CDD80_7513 [Ophiocordyceps camponoti-rufipedis]